MGIKQIFCCLIFFCSLISSCKSKNSNSTAPYRLPFLQSYIKCELNGKYDTNGTEYQIWTFENDSSNVRRLNICLEVPISKDAFLSFTNFSTRSAYEIPNGSEIAQTKAISFHENLEERHPKFTLEFDPLLYLKENSHYQSRIVGGATGGGVGVVNVTTYNWKTSDSATPSGKSCFLNQSYDPVPTTLRGIKQLFNGKTLRIWVADNDWDPVNPNTNGKLHSNKVSAVLNAIADTTNLSIYEKVLQITGSKEWGEHNFSTVLPANHPYLDLVYYDINCDNLLGGVVGFYFSGNNFYTSSVPHSNESLVLFLDSKYFTQREDLTWEITDRFPSLSLNTIAHELQHMIHFYQKTILNRRNSSTWFNEQMSMAVEEIISSYIQGSQNNILFSNSIGLGKFAASSNCSLIEWNSTTLGCDLVNDYAHVLSYSSFLNRQFGINTLSELILNPEIDNLAIDKVLSKYQSSYKNSLHNLGVSIFLNPDKGNLPKGYGFKELFVQDYFGIGKNLHLLSANPYFYGTPVLYESLPKNLPPSSTINLHWKKEFSGFLNEDVYIPPFTIVSIILGTYPRN